MNMGEYGHDRGGETEGQPTYQELLEQRAALLEENEALRRKNAMLCGGYDRVDDSLGPYVTSQIPSGLDEDGNITY